MISGARGKGDILNRLSQFHITNAMVSVTLNTEKKHQPSRAQKLSRGEDAHTKSYRTGESGKELGERAKGWDMSSRKKEQWEMALKWAHMVNSGTVSHSYRQDIVNVWWRGTVVDGAQVDARMESRSQFMKFVRSVNFILKAQRNRQRILNKWMIWSNLKFKKSTLIEYKELEAERCFGRLVQ